MKSINLQRTESLLMELIPQALSSLNNSLINSLAITGVNCKKGKYDATVYFDGSDFDNKEIKEVIESLNRANGRIKSEVLSATGWYKCPNFKFEVDSSLENSKNIEELFSKIRRDEKKRSE